MSSALVMTIVSRELVRMEESSQKTELTLDQARKLLIYLRIYEPQELTDDGRPLAALSDEQLRAALSNVPEETA